MTTVLDNLEKAGLVRRSQEAEDRRCTTVTLTNRGETLMREVFPVHVEGMVEAFDVLTASEQEDLKRLCRKLGVGVGTAPES